MKVLAALTTLWVMVGVCSCGRVFLDDQGAYRDLVVAVHPNFVPSNCSAFFGNLESALTAFNRGLWAATHGRVRVGSVGVVLPPTLAFTCAVVTSPAKWQRWTTADIRVTEGGGDPGGGVGVHGHPWGVQAALGVGVRQPQHCGEPGDYITLDPDFLVEDVAEEDVDTIGRSLVGGWARYRWGVFEERGYAGDVRYPPLYYNTYDTPSPTSCTPSPTQGRWESDERSPSNICNLDDVSDTNQVDTDVKSCVWRPESDSSINSSLLYRADIPSMWGFCDDATHDRRSPTPHNLLCRGKSIWEVMSKHPDFKPKPPAPAVTLRQPTEAVERTTKVTWIKDSRVQQEQTKGRHSHDSSTESGKGRVTWNRHSSSMIRTLTSPRSSSSSSSTSFHPSSTTERLSSKRTASPKSRLDVRSSEDDLPIRRRRGEHYAIEAKIKRRSRSNAQVPTRWRRQTPDTSTGRTRLISDRLTSPISEISSTSIRSPSAEPQYPPHPLPQTEASPESVGSREFANALDFFNPTYRPDDTGFEEREPVLTHVEGTLRRPSLGDVSRSSLASSSSSTLGLPAFPSFSSSSPSSAPQDHSSSLSALASHSGPPGLPQISYYSSPPQSVILALDLSDLAVAKVNIDALRGGMLRWLWGLGMGVSVGVVGAYNNASYPLTLGPLLPAPTSQGEMEDVLALLPSLDEVEDDMYGGEYCLHCVLTEASKMFERSGVDPASGLLIVTSCDPVMTQHHLDLSARLHLTVQTLALCPSASPLFDQLSRRSPGGAWVLPSGRGEDLLLAEDHIVAQVLTAATREALGAPGDPSLVRTATTRLQVASSSDVGLVGPYSTVSGHLTVASSGGEYPPLLVISSQHQAKVLEVTNASAKKLDIVRDTNQRFWLVLGKNPGQINYTIKFLTSSITFPFSLVFDVYERKREGTGVQVRLRTNREMDREPLEPGSHPLVVWAEVISDGKPVIGAKVALSVTLLGTTGNTSVTVDLLDDGNAEPDTRAHDGTYTRFLTWLPGEGRYSLVAHAHDNKGAASLLTPRRRDGRVVPVSAGTFSVSSAPATITVALVTSDDLVPPSRITDLKVTLIRDTIVNLTWSAPGGDLDQGSASAYELRMYTERSALDPERFNVSTIDVYCISDGLRTPSPVPAPYGTPQQCLTELPFTNLIWYFAIRAVDTANNTAEISNIVSAYVPEPPTTPEPTPTGPIDQSRAAQTVLLSSVTSSTDVPSNETDDTSRSPVLLAGMAPWQLYLLAAACACLILLAVVAAVMCLCCRSSQGGPAGVPGDSKDPERPIYKIYVNNAYIQEEDGEIKVVQDWVNSLSKYGGAADMYGGDPSPDSSVPSSATPAAVSGSGTGSSSAGGGGGKAGSAGAGETPLVEGRPRASAKYASPIRFGVLTNGSIMREACGSSSSSSSSSSKPSDEVQHEDFKYKDLSETTSNSTTDGGATSSTTSSSAEAPVQLQELGIPIPSISTKVPYVPSSVGGSSGLPPVPPPPPPPPPAPPALGSSTTTSTIGGSTVISIRAPPTSYSSDEEGGFRPRTLPGPGPRRYLPYHFSSFRYLPPPPEYRLGTNLAAIDVPAFHTISRATGTLPHGTVRSVKKRRHISFV